MKTESLELLKNSLQNGGVVLNTINFRLKSNLSVKNTLSKENIIKISWLVGNGRNQNIGS